MGIARPSSARGKTCSPYLSLSLSLSLSVHFFRGPIPYCSASLHTWPENHATQFVSVEGNFSVGNTQQNSAPPILLECQPSRYKCSLSPPMIPSTLCLSWSIDRESPAFFAHGGIEQHASPVVVVVVIALPSVSRHLRHHYHHLLNPSGSSVQLVLRICKLSHSLPFFLTIHWDI